MSENKDTIDLGKMLSLILQKKKLFLKVWVITFLLSCLYILPKPRYYSSSVVLAPEVAGESAAGGLGSLASSFGINLGGATNDAIYPMLYPDLISSNDFVVSLFDIPVTTADGDLTCDLYTYLDKHQKYAFYTWPMRWAKRKIAKLTAKPEPASIAGKRGTSINPFRMTRRQSGLVEVLKQSIGCSVDKKTEVFTISVKAQDPLIAATLADSVSARLQRFITEYRTSKARVDVEYYTKLSKEAKAEYEHLRRLYTGYADSHTDVSLPSSQAKLEDLENDMQLKYNAYNAMNTQLQAAQAKVQESTPAFTRLQSPTVALKASSPKRMIFVAFMLILATIGTSIWIVRKELSALYSVA